MATLQDLYNRYGKPAASYVNQHVVQPVENRLRQFNDSKAGKALNIASTVVSPLTSAPVKRFIKQGLQDTARLPTAMLISTPRINQSTFVPTTKFEKFALGNEPIQSFQTNAVNQKLQSKGLSPRMATIGAAGAGVLAEGLNFAGGEGKGLKGSAKVIAKLKNAENIATVLDKAGVAHTPELLATLSKEKNAGKVADTLASHISQIEKAHGVPVVKREAAAKVPGGEKPTPSILTTGNGMKVEISNPRPKTINVPVGDKSVPIEAKLFEHEGVTLALYNEKPLGGSHLYVLADPKTGATISSGQSEAGAILHATLDDPAYWNKVKAHLSNKQPKPDPLEALKNEARKYKSAEEFVGSLKNITDRAKRYGKTVKGTFTVARHDLTPAEEKLYDNVIANRDIIKTVDDRMRAKPGSTIEDQLTDLYNEAKGAKTSPKVSVAQTDQALQATKPELSSPVRPKARASQPNVKPSFDGSIPPSGTAKIGSNPAAPDSSFRQQLNDIYTQTLDRFSPLTRLGKQAGEQKAVENAIAGHYGAGSTAQYHTDFQLAPILQNTNLEDLKAYTIAKRDAELAGRGIKGSDAGAAQAEIARLNQKYGGNLAPLEQKAQELYKYQDGLVKKYLVDTGVISQEAYDAMRANNQSYIPFKRIMDTVDEHLGIVPGQGAANPTQNVIKGIKGSDRQIVDPLQSIVENTYKIVGVGKQQEAAKTLISLKDKLPEGIIVPHTGEVGNMPVISVFENGKKVSYQVPQDVAEAAKGMNQDQMSTIVKILATPTRTFRATATGINPEFFGPNIARDLQSAFVNAGVNPIDYVKGLAHYLKRDDIYEEFLKSGGLTSRLSLDTPALQQRVVDVVNTRNNRSIGGVVVEAGKTIASIRKPSDLFKILGSLGQASEQPTRIASFERELNKGLKAGLSREEAARNAATVAQDATTNFARRGSKTQSVNALYAFLNARAQGVDQLIRTAKKDPKGFAFRMGLLTQLPALITYAHNRNFPGYNDPRIISDYDKRDNYIWMLPNDRYIKIPKGDVGKLSNPTEQFLSYLDGKGGNVGKAAWEALKAFSPVSNPGDVVPTTLRPIVEGMSNKNFFTGNSIIPDYKKGFPAGKQDNNSTAPIYRVIGQKIGVSPAQIQNATQGYLTGFARLGEMASAPLIPDQYKTAKNTQGDPINRIPVVRRFVGGAKQSQQEYDLQQQKKARSLEYDINDIKSGIKRGELTPQEGLNQINKLMNNQTRVPTNGVQAAGSGPFSDQEKKQLDSYATAFGYDGLTPESQAAKLVKDQYLSSDIKNKLTDYFGIKDQVKTEQEKLAFKTGNEKRKLIGDTLYYRDSKGEVKSAKYGEIVAPKLTGDAKLDKKLKSSYQSAITTRQNEVIKLYQEGVLSAEEASSTMKELEAMRSKSPKSGGKSGRKGNKTKIKAVYKKAKPDTSRPKIVAPVKKVALPKGPNLPSDIISKVSFSGRKVSRPAPRLGRTSKPRIIGRPRKLV